MNVLERPGTHVRFPFGANWRRFVNLVDEDRIRHAEAGLVEMIGDGSLAGRSFLDVGCGSGLMSFAALRLGADRVHSFDADAASVAAAEHLKRRHAPAASVWTIERGDILDSRYIRTLGTWHVVYSWGVLHHTGHLWQAIANVLPLVADDGLLFIAIYNDQGWRSRYWRTVKQFYNHGALQRGLVLGTHIPVLVLRGVVGDLLRRRNPLQRYRDYRLTRGMSMLHDWLDWLGGYPFETATPAAVQAAVAPAGFVTVAIRTREGTWGCNEFVFARAVTAGPPATRDSASSRPQ
jgi:2-polyprenyl-3-methyl-5-hydroxy-6-metoxy-1,4-benzoquinol methylase